MVIALDVSSKPGYALFEEEKLVDYGTIFPEKEKDDFGVYPFNYIGYSNYIVDRLVFKVLELKNDRECEVVVEETNAGRNNYSQKLLEFIHFGMCSRLSSFGIKPKYIRTGVWRKFTNANQNDAEKKHNAKYGRSKRKKAEGDKTRVRIDGKLTRRLDTKDYAIRAFKEHFGVELHRTMEDAAEASLLGLAFIKGAPVCDGTPKGGTLKGVK